MWQCGASRWYHVVLDHSRIILCRSGLGCPRAILVVVLGQAWENNVVAICRCSSSLPSQISEPLVASLVRELGHHWTRWSFARLIIFKQKINRKKKKNPLKWLDLIGRLGAVKTRSLVPEPHERPHSRKRQGTGGRFTLNSRVTVLCCCCSQCLISNRRAAKGEKSVSPQCVCSALTNGRHVWLWWCDVEQAACLLLPFTAAPTSPSVKKKVFGFLSELHWMFFIAFPGLAVSKTHCTVLVLPQDVSTSTTQVTFSLLLFVYLNHSKLTPFSWNSFTLQFWSLNVFLHSVLTTSAVLL